MGIFFEQSLAKSGGDAKRKASLGKWSDGDSFRQLRPHVGPIAGSCRQQSWPWQWNRSCTSAAGGGGGGWWGVKWKQTFVKIKILCRMWQSACATFKKSGGGGGGGGGEGGLDSGSCAADREEWRAGRAVGGEASTFFKPTSLQLREPPCPKMLRLPKVPLLLMLLCPVLSLKLLWLSQSWCQGILSPWLWKWKILSPWEIWKWNFSLGTLLVCVL